MLAATAIEHDLYLVTRNVKDFQELGVDFAIPTQKLVFAQRQPGERDTDEDSRGARQRRAAN